MEDDKKFNDAHINWFPGHMEKARRQMQDSLKLVDLVIELRDARLPLSSANPIIEKLIGDKPHLIVLTKRDMADPKVLDEWLAWFKGQGKEVLAIDSLNDGPTKVMTDKIREMLKDKIERAKRRGIRNKVLRAMVCGIPNVGKSTLINAIAKKKAAKVENRPGVTRSLTWIRLADGIELMDTPGVLWPKLQDQEAAIKLVMIAAIKEDVTDLEAVVDYALDYLAREYPDLLKDRYHLASLDGDIIQAICHNMKFYLANDRLDIERARRTVLSDLRSDKLAGISLERPGDVREDRRSIL